MKKRISVTEDDPGLQQIFRNILEGAGYIVEIMANGSAIFKNKFVNPDLFLLDKQLEGMDGITICKNLKSGKLTKNIPVIMISANPDIGVLATEAGANAYIEKPFDKKHLLKMVGKYI